MQYMLLIYESEKEFLARSAAQRDAIMGEYLKYTQDIVRSGHFKAGDPLEATSAATTVRVRDGRTLTTDGPFAETKEQLGGYYLVEAENLDDALRLAARIPSARWGSIEVRPVMKVPTLP